ncbi:GspE/PulE/PilB domain-containing protein [Alienimonas californiensis]|uniref:Bacteriophage N4 adsorption protein B n=1 Tax=Alienimonas californiensis TaxID=2527989 RepID=A0A517P4L6_9PLAN|nr:general secretion pathway protein GspE [Alienimonas californiensis]QDT14295.1 bacteriophage N4 adsorption protein B [Alienimonas californiensis]
MADVNVYTDWLKIPKADVPPEGPPDHYALLKLDRFEDNPDKVRASYRKLNQHVRGYASGEYAEQSQELLNELAKAMLALTDEGRKREYDASLGRKFKEETNELGRVPMGRLLVKAGKISREQLTEAEGFAEARGLDLRDALVQMKLVPAKLAYRAYAREQGLSYADLGELAPDEDVLRQFPKATAKRHGLIPLIVDDDAVLVATCTAIEPEMEEELRLRFGKPPKPVIVTPAEMTQAITRYYTPEVDQGGAAAGPAKAKTKVPRKSFAQLDEGQQRERRQLGIIAICWGAIIPAAAAYFLLGDSDLLVVWALLGAAIGGGLAAAWAFLIYWK